MTVLIFFDKIFYIIFEIIRPVSIRTATPKDGYKNNNISEESAALVYYPEHGSSGYAM
jgi:hypothetical protein